MPDHDPRLIQPLPVSILAESVWLNYFRAILLSFNLIH